MVYGAVDFVCAVGVIFIKCLSKAFALSILMMAVLVLKQMLVFCWVSSFLLDSFAMVPHQD